MAVMKERPLYQDVFRPVLLNSPSLKTSGEQTEALRRVLDICCSDSRFAQKAYDSIQFILASVEAPLIPIVTSLTPATAVLGAPNFTLSVKGTGFDPDSLILWNGTPELTTYVSDTELTTLVNMETATIAVDIPVNVQNGLGVLSNSMTFSLTDAALMSVTQKAKPTATTTPVKK